jgi:hypothetical protein
VAFVAFAKSERRPVAGFVNGAFVKLRIAETSDILIRAEKGLAHL